MKKFLLVLALLPLTLVAQQDAVATKILDDVSNKNKAYTTTTVDFEFNISDTTTKQNDKKVGTLKLKGAKYALKFRPIIRTRSKICIQIHAFLITHV